MNVKLSVYNIREDFKEKLQETNQLILHAPAGSGKSTLIPQFLIDDILDQGKKVIVLQPRRLAARLLSSFVAKQRGSIPGEEVGYQIRLESRQSENTRILFVTEGVLMNRLLNHDVLAETGALVFDEFHERHLETDLSLALALDLQKKHRPDLKIIVMSATLEISGVSKMLSNSIVLKAEGRNYPVSAKYLQPKPGQAIWEAASDGIESVLTDFKEGSALVFMPGIFEIRKTIETIQKKARLQHFQVLPLHSSLPASEQDKAIQEGNRKIIVTTNVAETSITIPDIRLVVDSGLARISRFDTKRGINMLFAETISKSSASQRTGRAGRVAPGISVRLWSEFSHEHRHENNTPEIQRVDLSETVLALMAAGQDPDNFPWVEAPAGASMENAFKLLHQLGAIDKTGKLTSLGNKMAMLRVHPRFARMLNEAEDLGCTVSAAVLVAITQSSGFINGLNDPVLKQERTDMFGHCGSDLIFELNAWLWAGSHQFKSAECNRYGINSGKARDIGKLALQILQKTSVKSHTLPEGRLEPEESVNLRKCIFAGFSDFIAIRHRINSPVCQMMYGRSGQLHRDSSVQDAKYLVANEIEESKTAVGIQAYLRKVTEIEPEWIGDDFLSGMDKSVSYLLSKDTGRFMEVVEYSANQLVIKREQFEIKEDDTACRVITRAIMEKEIAFPQWDEEVEHFVRRVNFAALHAPHYQIPAIHEEEKEFILQQAVYKCRSLNDIRNCNVWPSLRSWLSFEQMGAVNMVAPDFITLPHRKKPVRLRYDEKGDVILSETIQALYDCPLPVTVAEGKIPVIFELLAPNRRPVQITRDLEYFWKNSYLEIKKELKGRYPKHEWR